LKSITIHKIDDSLFNVIRKRAVKSGKSLNQTIKQLLSESLGTQNKVKNYSEFNEFCGIWSKDEYKEFKTKTNGFEKINPDDWK
jgi:hypothetical protein